MDCPEKMKKIPSEMERWNFIYFFDHLLVVTKDVKSLIDRMNIEHDHFELGFR